MQYYNLFLYINYNYPENLRMFFSEMDFANFGFIPNPFNYILKIDEETVYDSGKFAIEGVP